MKSFFTLVGVMIGVMFLIAVVSIVEGMSDYVENDFAAKIIGVNTFDVSRRANFTPNETDEQERASMRNPRIFDPEAEIVRAALPASFRSAIVNQTFINAAVPGVRQIGRAHV